jgi:hypothetical protein
MIITLFDSRLVTVIRLDKNGLLEKIINSYIFPISVDGGRARNYKKNKIIVPSSSYGPRLVTLLCLLQK